MIFESRVTLELIDTEIRVVKRLLEQYQNDNEENYNSWNSGLISGLKMQITTLEGLSKSINNFNKEVV